MNRNRTQPQGTSTRREKKSISRAVNKLERIEKELWQNSFFREQQRKPFVEYLGMHH